MMARKSGESQATEVLQLVGEIVHDAETLVSQQFQMLREEVREGVLSAGEAAVEIGAGAGLVAVGGALGALMLVHGLHRASRLPLWSCYGLVGGTLGAVGAGLLTSGIRRAKQTHLAPEQTIEALKENVEWLKEQAT